MIYVLLGEGYEEIEAIAPVDILRRAQLDVQYVGIGGKTVTGAHAINIEADITIDEINYDDMEMLVVPGGGGGVASVEASEKAMEALMFAFNSDRYVAMICAAPTILGKLGLINGRKAICYPGMENEMGGALMQRGVNTVVDGKLITGKGPATASDFGLTLVEVLTDSSMKKTIMHFMAYSKDERNSN